MKVGKYFDYDEFLKSHAANKHGFKEQYQPPDKVMDNIHDLVIYLLDPIRDLLPDGIIMITSGYRCKRLNDAVGSKDTSQHRTGQAADINYYEKGIEDNKKLWKTILDSGLEFDQIIDEKNLSWIHISYRKGNNRNQILKIK